jgi:hypothetical protein
VFGIISTLCGAETWKQMEEFGKAKQKLIKTFMPLPYGVPSDDTINRVFSAIDPKKFELCFVNWASSLSESFKSEVIAIDGKTARGAKSDEMPSSVHIVSAWANDRNIVCALSLFCSSYIFHSSFFLAQSPCIPFLC